MYLINIKKFKLNHFVNYIVYQKSKLSGPLFTGPVGRKTKNIKLFGMSCLKKKKKEETKIPNFL